MQIQTRWWAIALFGTIAASAVQAAPVIDNERLTVWDIKLAQGESGPATPHDQDAVILIVEGGEVRTRDRRGHTRVVTRNFGDGIFVPKGTDAVDTLVAGGPAHEVLIALKNYPRPPLASSAKYPTAFPRIGAVKVLETPRVILWNYHWTRDRPTPMHIHDKDFVVAFRDDSSQVIVEPGGGSHVNQVKAGEILFFKRGLTHSEGVLSEHQSAVYMELK